MNNNPLVYIGLGSNLENPISQIEKALKTLKSHSSLSDFTQSSLYRSKPLAEMKQPDYINAVACFSTQLSPMDLLQLLQQIETDQGRTRTGERWSARTLDLDILLFGQQIMQESLLQIPHPGLKQRNFVLYPLAELDPHLKLPDNSNIQTLLEQCSTEGLTKLE